MVLTGKRKRSFDDIDYQNKKRKTKRFEKLNINNLCDRDLFLYLNNDLDYIINNYIFEEHIGEVLVNLKIKSAHISSQKKRGWLLQLFPGRYKNGEFSVIVKKKNRGIQYPKNKFDISKYIVYDDDEC